MESYSKVAAASHVRSPRVQRLSHGSPTALQRLSQVLGAMSAIVMSIRILKYFQRYPRLDIVAQTLARAMADLRSFCLVFAILFMGCVF